jgi:hypothetical protein
VNRFEVSMSATVDDLKPWSTPRYPAQRVSRKLVCPL